MRRYLAHVAGHDVSSYKVLLYVGCVAGVFAGAAVAGERGLDEELFAFTVVGLLIPALLGARIWFVVRHGGEGLRLLDRSQGGAGLFGGLIVAFAVSLPVLWVAGLPFWAFWDAAAVTMLVGLIFTRFGCLMNGCCAGRPTDGPLGMRLPNIAGEWQRRYPTQLMESGWALLLLAVAITARNAMAVDGALFGAVVALYCLGRVPLEAAREHRGWRWAGS